MAYLCAVAEWTDPQFGRVPSGTGSDVHVSIELTQLLRLVQVENRKAEGSSARCLEDQLLGSPQGIGQCN